MQAVADIDVHTMQAVADIGVHTMQAVVDIDVHTMQAVVETLLIYCDSTLFHSCVSGLIQFYK
jgi:hypothetical protein